MHRLRHQHATTPAWRGEPRLDRWRSLEPCRLSQEHVADAILAQDLTHFLDSGAVDPVVYRKELPTGAMRCLQHPVAFRERRREWFFAYDVLASLERLDRVLFMHVMRQQHTDALDLWIAQHLLPTVEHALHAGCLGALAGELDVQVVDASHFCSA